jgi:hypothetical protein
MVFGQSKLLDMLNRAIASEFHAKFRNLAKK